MTKGLNLSLGGVGRAIGSELGSAVGKAFGGKTGASAGRNIGGELGKVAGDVAPAILAFKHGGKVNAPKGKPVKAILHGQEYVLPAGVKPTEAQKKAVAKMKADAKKKK